MPNNNTNAMMNEHQSIEVQKKTFVNLIDNRIVHKSKKENVHIYNIRRAIPHFIDQDVFENDLPLVLSKEELDFISSYYTCQPVINTGNDSFEKNIYCLKSLPLKIRSVEFAEILDTVKHDEDREFLLRFYSPDEKGDYFELTGVFSEMDEIRIGNILKLSSMLVTDSEKSIISSMLEKVDSVKKEDTYYASMFVDPEHDYFFEHALDHVPGMMIIESARQMFYSCYHLFGNTPLADVDFILSNMNVNFREYLWMSYPIRIQLKLDHKSCSDEGYWNKCGSSILFFQEHKEKAAVNLGTSNIKKAVLDSIHAKKELKKALTRNEEISSSHKEIHLRLAQTNNIGFFGSIIDISPKHITVEFRTPVTIEKVDRFSFNINLDKSIHAHGACCLEWQHKNEDLIIARFRIDDIDSSNSASIIEIIKKIAQSRELKMVI